MKRHLFLSISNKLAIVIFSFFSFIASAQTFSVDTLLYNGDINKRINIVVLGDGYTSAQISQFLTDASSLSTYLFSIAPFDQYKSYFNVFAIKVISTQAGASHPGTATDVGEPVIPVVSVTNYLGSTFDYASIHRLLVPTKTVTINSVLAANFPLYDQVLIIANSTEYGGSGGSFATTSVDGAAQEIAVHEIGHSFANLGDEYWNGMPRECPNMTTQSNPSLVKWKNWININQVGVYPYGSTPPASQWYRPHQSCKMRYLGSDFCSVCQEAIIEKIHSLTNSIDSYTPSNSGTINAPAGLLKFTYNPLKPIPNTLKSIWKLNSTVIATNVDSVSISNNTFSLGNNTVTLTVIDTNTKSKAINHISNHTYSVTWTVNSCAAPSQPSAIVASGGIATVCAGESRTYTITPVAGLTYTWIPPVGATITSGQGTNSIVLDFTSGFTATDTLFVIASNSCGTSTASSLIIVKSTAALTPVITGSGSVCPNSMGTIYSVTAVSGYTYNWTVTGGTISGSSTGNSISIDWGAGPNGSVSITQTSGGCPGTATKNISFGTSPGAFNITFAPSDSICAGASTVITVNGVTSASFFAAATGSTALGTSPFITPILTTTTDYYIEATVSGGCPSTNRQKVTVVVVPNPNAPTITFSNNDSICVGETTTLTATPIQPNVTYSFYNAATGGALIGSSPLTVTPTVTTDHYLEVQSIYGCLASVTRTKYTVTIIPLPAAPTVAYSNNDSICSGKKTTIIASPTTPGVTYNFYTAATGGSIAGASPFMTQALLRDTTYYLETINFFGCKSDSNRNLVTIKVLPRPSPVAILTSPNDSICLGDSTTLKGLGSTGGNTITYNFYTASNGGSLVGSSPRVIKPTTSAYYYLEIKNDYGCVAKDIRDSVKIVINPLPDTPVLTGTNSAICEGKTTTLTASTIPSDATIIWYDVMTQGNPLDSGTVFTSPTLNSTTTFYLESVSQYGCINAAGRIPVTVAVKPLPHTNLISDAVNQTIYTGQLVTFTTSPNTYQVYQFYVDKDQVQSNSSALYSSVTLTDGQIVKVKVIENNCENWGEDTILIRVKPISNAFTPNGDGKNDIFLKGLDISIYNMWGQQLYEGKEGWNGMYKGSKVSPGTYYYIIRLKQIGTEDIKTLNGPVTVLED